MKQKEKSFDLFFENVTKEKSLNDDYRKVYDDIFKYITRHQSQTIKVNILLSAILDQMIEHQEQKNNVTLLVGKNTKNYIQNVEKTIRFKSELENIKKRDLERYTISGLWMTMCAYLVLLFVKEFLTQRFLIAFSVDLIVAAVAMVLTFKGIRTHYQLIQRYQMNKKPFIIEVAGFIVGLLVVVLTLKSPFDVSFLILVIAHLVSKKIFSKEL